MRGLDNETLKKLFQNEGNTKSNPCYTSHYITIKIKQGKTSIFSNYTIIDRLHNIEGDELGRNVVA